VYGGVFLQTYSVNVVRVDLSSLVPARDMTHNGTTDLEDARESEQTSKGSAD
jgi:hypothetical protein